MKIENIGPYLWWLLIMLFTIDDLGWDGILFVLIFTAIGSTILLLIYYKVYKKNEKWWKKKFERFGGLD
ncbi:MAG: hypothetical protein ILA34_00710 [Bacteroidaceae bacterium]|nr:hypothetical protein [Bacteroidaceae bacterium]